MKSTDRIIYWTPRIICILAILFISLFAADSFDSRLTLGQQLTAFLIHLIPSFILLAFLIIGWKWELVGGIIFTAVGFGFAPFIFMKNYHMNQSIWMSLGIILMINVPFIIAGILFIIGYYRKKRSR
jgi:hypothetical protein